jgi:hypothetical protein
MSISIISSSALKSKPWFLRREVLGGKTATPARIARGGKNFMKGLKVVPAHAAQSIGFFYYSHLSQTTAVNVGLGNRIGLSE